MNLAEPFVVPPGGSRSWTTRASGGKINLKVSANDTAGVWALFEIPTIPNVGPPLHYHRNQDEWFYVLSGDHDFRVGSSLYRIEPGGSIFGPRMVPHTWENVGVKQGKMLALVQPAGQLEGFFVEFSQLLSQGSPDGAALAQVFAKYDMEVVGPPLNTGKT